MEDGGWRIANNSILHLPSSILDPPSSTENSMPFALEQLTEGLSIAAVINPQNLTQNTSANSGNGIDASKFRRIMAVVLVGAGGGNITAKLQSASTSGGTCNDVP